MPDRVERVLIWCKTYPELSERYKETVCTAAVRENGSPVRIYPVPLRYLEKDQKYRLYDWVELAAKVDTSDRRPESHKLAAPEVRVVGRVSSKGGWTERREMIFKDTSWHYECLDDLKAREAKDRSSLGFVPVGSIERIWTKPRSEEERLKHEAKQNARHDQQGLFTGTEHEEKKYHLAFQKARVHVKWTCRNQGRGEPCPGHTAGVLDWGLGELARRDGDAVALQRMEMLCDLKRHELAFFVGNFKQHPKNFGIIGLWYPLHSEVEKARKATNAAEAQLGLFK
jgi:hypothetical protein